MSFIHFQITLTEENESQSIYKVTSSSFRSGSNIELGKVFIEKFTRRYYFTPSEKWISLGFPLPHTDYDKECETQDKIWPWTLLIHKRIISIINKKYSEFES